MDTVLMPEGDTVWHTAAVLREALGGKTLTHCDIRVPRYATVDLAGQVVDEVLSRGKHLFIRIGPASIHAHLKMEGSLRVSRRPADHRTRIILEAGAVRVVGADLGTLEVLERPNDLQAVAHLGPDLLGDSWNAQVAVANFAAIPERALAETLLDQRVMAGIGNVYANELCFLSGHLPSAPVGNVRDPLRLANRAREMLRANRSRWNRTTTGDLRPGRQLWVYGRAGAAARRSRRTAARTGSASGVRRVRVDPTVCSGLLRANRRSPRRECSRHHHRARHCRSAHRESGHRHHRARHCRSAHRESGRHHHRARRYRSAHRESGRHHHPDHRRRWGHRVRRAQHCGSARPATVSSSWWSSSMVSLCWLAGFHCCCRSLPT